ncbi:hypothetical protein BDV28DRAFT_164818 [Aspergillus coremiiformis]|uniref:Uncharacterized protein n=1 Tax=Aspergillus coremiiformis TaxID=138285 RepID=A0A5N6Z7I9_9EURO|nr:hypothetical protein BDV28DRAFT_164818 [Aspergillus coremiiformis]
MHFSTIFAATLALAPAVYGSGVAQVQVNAHHDCPSGRMPGHSSLGDEVSESFPKKVYPTKESCVKAKLDHGDDIQTYSFTVDILNKATFQECHAVGIYTNEECVGYPDWIVPFNPGEGHAQSPCLPELAFEKYASVTLICDGNHDKGSGDKHETGGKENEGAEKGGEQQERQGMKPAPKVEHANSFLDGLGL